MQIPQRFFIIFEIRDIYKSSIHQYNESLCAHQGFKSHRSSLAQLNSSTHSQGHTGKQKLEGLSLPSITILASIPQRALKK